MELVKRIKVKGSLAGYVVRDDDGRELAMGTRYITAAIRAGRMTLDNATVSAVGKNIFCSDGYTLRGKGCSLQQLPYETRKADDFYFYLSKEPFCKECKNKYVEPICARCLADGTYPSRSL